jgi:hypothetical protein
LSCRDLLNTTLCDKVCHAEIYLIQHYVIKFVIWGVLDTTLCDKVCHAEIYLIQHYVIKFVMQRFTWYNIMWSSLSCRDLLDTTLCDKVCHAEIYLIQHYVIKFVIDRSVVFSGCFGFHWPPQYSWNIVESGVKHHNSNPVLYIIHNCFRNPLYKDL